MRTVLFKDNVYYVVYTHKGQQHIVGKYLNKQEAYNHAWPKYDK